MLNLHDLRQTFDERARWTNRMLLAGTVTRLGLLEESITDINLIEIATRHPNHIISRKFTRREEGATSGADWIWTIGRPGRWFSMLVQAKVMNPSRSRFHLLDYNGGNQRRKLVSFARRHRLYPVYCIYSAVPPRSGPSLSYALQDADARTIAEHNWACSFVAPRRVRQASAPRRDNRRDPMRVALPWMWPFLTANEADEVEPITHITRQLADARALAQARCRQRDGLTEGSSTTGRIAWDDPDPVPLITTEIPRIVQRMLSAKLTERHVPVSHVAVLSTVNLPVPQSTPRALEQGGELSSFLFARDRDGARSHRR
jgi:hypothetical protein